MTDLDLPAPVRAVLDAWLAGASRMLGENLVAVRLHGGLAVGDFAPGWSDVDVFAVVRELPDGTRLAHMSRLQAELEERFVRRGESGWRSGQAVEARVVTPAVLAGEPGPIADIGPGSVLVADALPAFERLWSARYGRTILGRELATAPPTTAALEAQLAADLDEIVAGGSRTPIWRADALARLSRALAFWTRDALLGKTEALRREASRGGPFAAGFGLAAALRREGSRACAGRTRDLATVYRTCAPAAVEALRPFAR